MSDTIYLKIDDTRDISEVKDLNIDHWAYEHDMLIRITITDDGHKIESYLGPDDGWMDI